MKECTRKFVEVPPRREEVETHPIPPSPTSWRITGARTHLQTWRRMASICAVRGEVGHCGSKQTRGAVAAISGSRSIVSRIARGTASTTRRYNYSHDMSMSRRYKCTQSNAEHSRGSPITKAREREHHNSMGTQVRLGQRRCSVIGRHGLDRSSSSSSSYRLSP